MTKLEVARVYSSSKIREDFNLAEDTYKGWVLLAAQTGSFHFAIQGISEDRTQLVQFGDLLFCPPGHTLWRKARGPFSFVFVELITSIELKPGKVRIHDTERLHSTFRYLRQENNHTNIAMMNEDVAHHLILDLLFLATREWNRQISTVNLNEADPMMARAAQILQSSAFKHDFSLHQLAQQLSITPSQLTRRFNTAFGVPPVKYLTSLRLNRARVMLAETDLTLEEIADQCGYQNAFYFSRVFTKHMKQPPSSFRKNYRV